MEQLKAYPNYGITREGNVISLRTGRTLKPGISKDGYARVSLVLDGVPHTRSVHALMAETFLGPRPKGWQVDHKNHNRSDNRLENLEYVTPQENVDRSQPNMIGAERPKVLARAYHHISPLRGVYRVQVMRGGIKYKTVCSSLPEAIVERDRLYAEIYHPTP